LARKRSIKVSLLKSEATDHFSDPTSDPFSGLLSGESTGQPSANHGEGQQDGEPIQVTETQVLTVLTHGEMAEQGLLPYSSNTSFLITTTHNGMTLPAVYKPRRGENPLWDFEWGTLCQRETAAYLVSRTLGWDLVPPTVLREGTRGVGSVQLFISNNDSEHYFTVQEDARFVPAMRRLALFDFVVNNADRKSGHCLLGDDQRLWAIDHGICFHTEYKLRSVIWEFSDMPIEPQMISDLQELQDCLLDERSSLCQILCQLLTSAERSAMLARTKILLQKRTFPSPQTHRRNYPWPPI
jgi:uncharacterized repeat protein (TIGR03843 family)